MFETASILFAVESSSDLSDTVLLHSKEISSDSFGLRRFLTTYQTSRTFDLSALISQYQRTWILYTKLLIFNNSVLNMEDSPIYMYNTEYNQLIFDTGYSMSICYGALTSMNKFRCYSSHYYKRKTCKWIMRFNLNKFEIDDLQRSPFRRVITVQHIDRGVVVDVHKYGFILHICIRGNPAEYIQAKP
ncbi:unnamed protein product, partial [Didymodactylos carnosus]